MNDASLDPVSASPTTKAKPSWRQRALAFAFAFFAIKGLLWLGALYAAWVLAR